MQMQMYVDVSLYIIYFEFRPMDQYYWLNVNQWIDGYQFNNDFLINFNSFDLQKIHRWINTIDGQHDR